jgi:hypothetical protein
MKLVRPARIALSACAFAFSHMIMVSAAGLAAAGVPSSAAAHDGRHDFDFHFGRWKTHIARLTHPATGASRWGTLDGTVVVRPVWNGRANLEEVDAAGPGGHFEGLGLFVYNPQARQWSLSFARAGDGALGSPPSVGEFKNGRGEFFDQELVNGKSVIVRILWLNITPNSHRFEQAVSSDGGRTWETNFRASLTRDRGLVDRAARPADAADRDGQNAFDFAAGRWKERTVRLLEPLSRSHTWVKMDGVSVDKTIWNGRANIVELESDGPKGHLELMSLRLYNPRTRQWSLYFATSRVGVVSDALVGAFKDGHGEFFGNDTFKGRTILVRFRIDALAPNAARSEQAFSNDGGQTWEVNWVNEYTRIPGRS